MDQINTIVEKQKKFFNSGQSKNIQFRKKQLIKLKNALISNESKILEALKKDLNKSETETYLSEVQMVIEEINYMLKNISKLSKAKKVKTPLMHFHSVSKIYKEPYGIVLVISPWNYPFQLSLVPMIGAIASGNCAIIKPSEYSINTSKIIKNIINETFNEDYITVIQGGKEITEKLISKKLDYIFFTGSVPVGKSIMEMASKNLIPVTLELGGKSPCIVDETADIQLASKRIAWGKFLNAGQTCVAPDYILVHKKVKDDLIKNICKYIKIFYGDNPHKNPQYAKIINNHHFQRLNTLIKNSSNVIGGRFNDKTYQIEPTILKDTSLNSEIMENEIFGPILPIIEINGLDDAISIINSKPKSLALYLFTTKKENEKLIIDNISFGGGCINDTVIHLATPYMPFGGVGESGMGSCHGATSFNTFSHNKSILNKSNFIDISLRYPPYKKSLSFIKKLLNFIN